MFRIGMLSKESSIRLNLLRFPLIVGVVFIHAYGTTVGLSGGSVGVAQNGITDFVQNSISQGIARTAVPLFFLMSGYLFFAGVTWSKENYFNKIKSRIKTLLIPFLFWNVITLLLIALAQALPATQVYFSGNNVPIASFGVINYINAILGISRFPISYQFWFIRDLMLLVLLTPIINILSKKSPITFIAILFIFWFLDIWPINAPSSEATFFFGVGCLLSIMDKDLFSTDKYGVAIATTYIVVLAMDIVSIKSELNPFLHKIGIILGVIALLFSTKLIGKSQALRNTILSLSGASFFVFAAHEPLLTVSRKVAYKLIEPQYTYSVLGLYFLVPILVIIFLVW
jgi:hypothetical protein